MPTVADVCDYLNEIAPLELAAEWDNVGLLLGDPAADVKRVMTCLTLTPDVAEEAVAKGVDLVVTHHPIFFKPVQRVTAETWEGAVILKLAGAGCAVYSAHTAWDDAPGGPNNLLSQFAGSRIETFKTDDMPGWFGEQPTPRSLREVVKGVAVRGNINPLEVVVPEGDNLDTWSVSRFCVACGAAGGSVRDARARGYDLFVTGEMRFHDMLYARHSGIAVIVVGHFSSEIMGMQHLGEDVAVRFRDVEVLESRSECPPSHTYQVRIGAAKPEAEPLTNRVSSIDPEWRSGRYRVYEVDGEAFARVMDSEDLQD